MAAVQALNAHAPTGQDPDYEDLLEAARLDTQLEPCARRILSVGCRVDGHDCQIEVGKDDPITGDRVLALFRTRGAQPYSVYTTRSAEEPALRIKHVYWVNYFA
jgi:hypothetical protein